MADQFRAKVLVVGRAGVGKTSLLRTIPKDERVCTVSVEGGLLAVSDMVRAGRVQGVAADSWADAVAALNMLRTEWKGKYDWVFVDSLSEAAAKCFTVYWDMFSKNANNFGLWQHYSEALCRLVRGFKDLPLHVVFTSLLASKEDGGRTLYFPDVPQDAVKTRVMGMFDEVFLMDVRHGPGRERRRVFRTDYFDSGKDRAGGLDPEEPAHLGRVRDKIIDNLKNDKVKTGGKK
jgi:hypothetical protein